MITTLNLDVKSEQVEHLLQVCGQTAPTPDRLHRFTLFLTQTQFLKRFLPFTRTRNRRGESSQPAEVGGVGEAIGAGVTGVGTGAGVTGVGTGAGVTGEDPHQLGGLSELLQTVVLIQSYWAEIRA